MHFCRRPIPESSGFLAETETYGGVSVMATHRLSVILVLLPLLRGETLDKVRSLSTVCTSREPEGQPLL